MPSGVAVQLNVIAVSSTVIDCSVPEPPGHFLTGVRLIERKAIQVLIMLMNYRSLELK